MASFSSSRKSSFSSSRSQVSGVACSIDNQPEQQLLGAIHWNAAFALFLTRALLSQLRATAKHGPVLVQFVGSIAADLGFPRLTMYGASKAFMRSLARGLDNDEQLWDDTLMMTVLPLAKIGLVLNRPHYVEEAKRQFMVQ